MTVREFMEYSIDVDCQKFTLYDVDEGEEVFTGNIDACSDKYLEAKVRMFDVIDEDSPRLTLNVTLE